VVVEDNMPSILERPSLNKIFLIYGNIDDMFMSPDLQKSNFRPFLNSYLKSLGYRQIVFYSGAKNMGKYVLDDESALLAINKNKDKYQTPAQNQQKPARRILAPHSAPQTTENVTPQTQTTENKPTKLIYKQPKITPAEFLDDAKKMMADSTIKSAIVFTFFQDFVSDSSSPLQQYSELLSHLWDEYSLCNNENICIFLAPQMDANSIQQLFDRLSGGDVFKNRFFNDDGSINRRCTINIGYPNQDELKYMLEYLRIVGSDDKKLVYNQKDLPRILSLLMYLSKEADREENRAGYLSSIYENIAYHMKNKSYNSPPVGTAFMPSAPPVGTAFMPSDSAVNGVFFDEKTIKQIYSKYNAGDLGDPLQTLTNTQGWETVAKRISEIVKDYTQKRNLALQKHAPPQKSKNTTANERIDTPEDNIGFDYPIPHFILKGNPGVGKTTVARLIGQIFYETGILKKGMTIEATRDDLISPYVGGTTARTREAVINATESVLFIDDAYSLFEKTDEHNYPKQAIDELTAIMTNPRQYRFCLIMAGYPEPMDKMLKMNPGLLSRFSKPNILTIPDYPPELLKSIFINNCKKDGYTFWVEQPPSTMHYELCTMHSELCTFFNNLYDQRDRPNFGNARDVVTIAREVKMQASLRDDTLRIITQDDFGEYKKYFDKHGVDSIEDIYAEIDQYVGMEFVKELFEDVRLELLDIQESQKRGIKPETYPDHYIFSGNPGTGKTTVGKMIGNFYHLLGVLGGKETIFVDASDLIGEHVGASKTRTLEKIQDAIDHNSVLYIDEAYQIADTLYSSEIIGAMMTKMTENAADFKMIFGMYENRVEDFLKLNAGLPRRLRIVQFPDYTPSQLLEIFDRTVASQGRTVSEEARHIVSGLLEEKYNNRTESFGNAGEVKKLVVDMRKLLLKRTSRNPDIDNYTYTIEDIPTT